MDSFHFSCLKKLSTFSLLLLCLLLSWSCAASTTIPVLPQPSSAFLAADTLRIRGYSIFASLLVSISSTTNFSGTLLAPPDFAFSLASTRILNSHHPPPRPSIPVLLYHTLRPPLILTWPTLSSRDDGDELRTFYNNNCLYLFRSSHASEVSISSSPFTNPVATVKIRQPDLYVDENLIVHGIDNVLNPSFATRCSVTYSDPTADTVPLQVNRVFLDRAMRALKRNGYNVVASAMSIRRSDLLPLTSVTVLAVADEHLFMTPGGFRYDFRHHVVPVRQRFADLSRLAAGGVEFFTLAPNKTVSVVSNAGAVSVDGISVGMREVYHNRWMVVLSLLSSLDDVASSQPDPPAAAAAGDEDDLDPTPSPSPADDLPTVPSPAPIPGGSVDGKSPRVPSPAPISGVPAKGKSHRVPSPAPIHGGAANGKSPRVPSPAPIHGGSVKGKPHGVPTPAPARAEEFDSTSPILAPEASDDPADSDSVGAPSPAEVDENDSAPSSGSFSSSPSPSPEIEGEESSPVPSPATDDVDVVHCDLNVVISKGVEGGDLLCPDRPDRAVRLLRESGDDVEGFQPFDAQSQDAEDLTHSDHVKITEHVNIADDVFFYT